MGTTINERRKQQKKARQPRILKTYTADSIFPTITSCLSIKEASQIVSKRRFLPMTNIAEDVINSLDDDYNNFDFYQSESTPDIQNTAKNMYDEILYDLLPLIVDSNNKDLQFQEETTKGSDKERQDNLNYSWIKRQHRTHQVSRIYFKRVIENSVIFWEDGCCSINCKKQVELYCIQCKGKCY